MKMIKVWIDEELFDIVKEAADNKSMSVSEYVRDILSKNSYVDITLDFADIDHYVEIIGNLERKIDAILPTIYRSGKIYEQEAVIIKQILNQISEKSSDTWRYITALRTDMYDSVRKELYHTIRQHGYSKRHTKEMLVRFEKKYNSGDAASDL